MERNNSRKNTHKTQTGKLIAIGALVVVIIALLYYGFFTGDKAERMEKVEDPADSELGILRIPDTNRPEGVKIAWFLQKGLREPLSPLPMIL